MKINIRPATVLDIPAIHDLVRDLAIYEHAEKELTATVEDYLKDFEAKYFEVLVAEMNTEIVGMTLYYKTYSTWKGRMLYLEDFVVKESHRKMGIGQMLFDGFLNEAKSLDCRLVKWQVLDWNQPAISFYEKNKATIEKGWWNGKIFFTKDNKGIK